MAATTIYDVRLRYVLDDQTKAARQGLTAGMEQMKRSSEGLNESFQRLAGYAAAAFGVHEAKKAFIDFNSEMEQSRITIAGMMEMNVGGGFVRNLERANFLVASLQQEAKTSVGTTKDMVQMLSMIAQPLTAAGAGMQDLVDITKGAVVASMSMGYDSANAATQIREALSGLYTNRQQFTTALLAPLGYGGEAGRSKFRALDEKGRLAAVKKALTSDALRGMATAQETSFAGAMSTLKDNLEIALGKVGLPLFQGITAELNQWNAWILKNGEALSDWGRPVADALLEGFRYVRTVVEFMVEHRDLLLAIATGWAASRGGAMVGKAFGGVGGAFEGIVKLGSGAEGAAIGLGSFATSLAGAAQGLGAIALAATAAAAMLDRSQSRQIQNASLSAGTLPTALANMTTARHAVESGAYYGAPDVLGNKGNVLEPEAYQVQAIRTFVTQLTSTGLAGDNGIYLNKTSQALAASSDSIAKYAETLGVRQSTLNALGSNENQADYIAKLLKTATEKVFETYAQMPKLPPEPLTKDGKPVSNETKNNIHIHRIEVASDDPDRFVFALTRVIADATKNHSQSRHTWREGG